MHCSSSSSFSFSGGGVGRIFDDDEGDDDDFLWSRVLEDDDFSGGGFSPSLEEWSCFKESAFFEESPCIFRNILHQMSCGYIYA